MDGELPRSRALMASPVPEDQDVDGLLEARGAHLAALAEVQRWAGERPTGQFAVVDLALTAFLRWQLEDELTRLRTASFGQPA